LRSGDRVAAALGRPSPIRSPRRYRRGRSGKIALGASAVAVAIVAQAQAFRRVRAGSLRACVTLLGSRAGDGRGSPARSGGWESRFGRVVGAFALGGAGQRLPRPWLKPRAAVVVRRRAHCHCCWLPGRTSAARGSRRCSTANTFDRCRSVVATAIVRDRAIRRRGLLIANAVVSAAPQPVAAALRSQ